MDDNYIAGFMDRCARYNVDPVKVAGLLEDLPVKQVLDNPMVAQQLAPVLSEKAVQVMRMLEQLGIMKRPSGY